MTVHSILISFNIQYNTNFQEAVYISGNIESLGSWETHKAIRMNWKEGNWWTAEVNVTKEIAFDYKFFIANHDSLSVGDIKWEQGPNRSANIKGYTRSSIEIFDVWEFKKVILRLFDCQRILKTSSLPDALTYSKEQLLLKEQFEQQQQSPRRLTRERFYVTANTEIMGGLTKLKKLKKRSVIQAKRGTNEVKEIVFWEKQFLVKSSQQSLKYKFAYRSEIRDNDQIQRKASYINFSKNDVDFQGAFCINDKWIPEPFSFDQITENIQLGPYPENFDQIKQLAAKGVRAVFNLQTIEDMELNCLNWQNIQDYYYSLGIKLIHFPVYDMDVYDMAIKLTQATQIFANAISEYQVNLLFFLIVSQFIFLLFSLQNVYIHCTSGIYRSSQVIISYLHLNKGIPIKTAIAEVENKRPITKKNKEYLRQVYALSGCYGKQQQESAIRELEYSPEPAGNAAKQDFQEESSSPVNVKTTQSCLPRQYKSQSVNLCYCYSSSENASPSSNNQEDLNASFWSDQPTSKHDRRRHSFYNSVQIEKCAARIWV